MSIYFEKARELGNMILESELAHGVNEANKQFQADEKAIAKFEEYKQYEQNVRTSMQSEEVSKEEIDQLTKRLSELAIEVKQEPSIANLIYCENEFNAFVNQVLQVMKATITGEPEEASGCSSCSSAGGCGGGCH